MSVSEAPFRRLLRWYPRAWRVSNGEVFVATLVEAAEHDGRDTPTSADVRGAVIHGSGAHLTARLALVLSIAALTLSVVAAALYLSALSAGADAVTAFMLQLLTIGLIPLLTAVAAVSLIRDRGIIGDGRALGLVLLAVPALVLAWLAAWSWSVGFDAADAGLPAPPVARIWLLLLASAMAVGVASLSLFIDSLLTRTELSKFVRIPLAILASCVLTPVIGFALLMPYIGAGAALATAVSAAASRRALLAPVPTAPTTKTTPTHPVPARSPRSAPTLIRGLAIIAMIGGIVGVAYALTGSLWSPGATDGTVAMRQGITVLLTSAIPLLAAFGIWSDSRGTHRSLHVWGPLALLVGTLILLAAAYTGDSNSDGTTLWFFAGSVLAGGAIAWWITPRIRLPKAAALLIGIFAGLLYAAFLGMMLTPLLVFAVPLLGTLMLIGARTPTPKPDNSRSPKELTNS